MDTHCWKDFLPSKHMDQSLHQNTWTMITYLVQLLSTEKTLNCSI